MHSFTAMHALAGKSAVDRRVLVVDDDDDIRRLMLDLFGSLGVEAEEAAGGREALTHLRSDKWSAILLDLGMPDIDGFGVLGALTRHSPGLLPKVIVVSGLSSYEDRARQFGVSRFLRKPVDMPSLMRHLVDLNAL